MNNKQLFEDYISTMNTSALESTLITNAYRKISNVSFIEKLNDQFTILKTSGNTHLQIYKGLGVCSCNKDKKVMSFVGNRTKEYFSLSYLETDYNYFNLYSSCNKIKHDELIDLNEFYHFSIKPKETSEYKNHQINFLPLQEYKALSSQAICNMDEIEFWLESHKELYRKSVELLNEDDYRIDSVTVLVNKEFEFLYGKMNVFSILFQKEAYFKDQLTSYHAVKDSISELNRWHEFQKEKKHLYELFSSVFYDNRELTHYRLEFKGLKFNSEDFKHTLEYLSIIEKSQGVEYEGTIKTISDLEVFEKTETSSAFKKRFIVLSMKDFCLSEYKVTFSEGRLKHLDGLAVGDQVKVNVRLIGGESKDSSGKLDYKYYLFGWSAEKIDYTPKIEKVSSENDLYYKYMSITPF